MEAPPSIRTDIQHRLEAQGCDVLTPAAGQISRLASCYVDEPAPQGRGFRTTMYTADREYRRAVYEQLRPIVAEIVAGVLSGYRVCVASWLVKDAGQADSTVGLHQDWSFVDERHRRSINVWIPLTDVDSHNGCLEVVEYSQHVSTDHRAHGDARFGAIGATIRAQYLKPVPMARGQALIYDGALLHASPPNRSAERRVAVGAVLVPNDTALLHCFRVSPETVEVFAVDEAFFWTHVPGTRPQGVPLLGVVPASAAGHGADILTQFAARV